MNLHDFSCDTDLNHVMVVLVQLFGLLVYMLDYFSARKQTNKQIDRETEQT